MPFHVDAYIQGGVASGVVARAGHLREILDAEGELVLERVSWTAVEDPTPRPAGDLTIPIDDLLVAVVEDDASAVHASWHPIRLVVGPYLVEGEMPTLPGFDPDRSLTRPTGEFVAMRDVRLARIGPDGSLPASAPIGEHALVNRYVVEEVEADLMLGFYFPGATMVGAETAGGGTDADGITAAEGGTAADGGMGADGVTADGPAVASSPEADSA